MKRSKVTPRQRPSYPSSRGLSPALRRRLLLVGLLCMAPVPACDGFVQDTDGLMAYPQEEWSVLLPLEGSRTVDVGDAGDWIAYHLEIVVNDAELAGYMNDNAETLLDQIDELIEALDPVELEAGVDLDGVQQDIAQLIANAQQGIEDANTYQFLETTMVLDETSWEEGDTGGS